MGLSPEESPFVGISLGYSTPISQFHIYIIHENEYESRRDMILYVKATILDFVAHGGCPKNYEILVNWNKRLIWKLAAIIVEKSWSLLSSLHEIINFNLYFTYLFWISF